MARAPDFSLASELAKPSFTPAQRDAAALVELVVAGEDPTAERAATALAGLGDAGRRAIAARLGGDAAPNSDEDATELGDGATARLVGALGLLARRGDGEARATLIARTQDKVSRVRRAAIVALGKLGGADAGGVEARDALLARWDADDVTPDERRALAEALGKLGGDAALTRLRALDPGGDAELARRRDRALLIADRSSKRAEESEVATDVDPPAPIVVRLRCKPGLGPLLVEDLTAHHLGPTAHGDGAADVRLERAWSALFASRLWERAAIRVPLATSGAATARKSGEASDKNDAVAGRQRGDASGKNDAAPARKSSEASGRKHDAASSRKSGEASGRKHDAAPAHKNGDAAARKTDDASGDAGDPGAEAAAIVDALTAAPVRALLRAWTRGPIRWRLGFAHGHKRAIVWRVAKDVAARAPELINDPTQTTWDVFVADDALELSPRRIADTRFAWRVAEIPASSHPTVAASLAYVGEARHGDRVWDPFVGSAAELIERARLGSYASLLGTDLDDNALAAAKQNLAKANVEADLVKADARTHQIGELDLIVTNPPLGSRVKLDAAALLVACLPNFAQALAPGGRLVWITPAPKQTTRAAEQLGLRRTRSLPVDLGGVRGHLERWDR